MQEPSDTELVAQARAGDPDAFGRLIARYQPPAGRLARGMVGDPDLAGDLVQEALLRAFLSLDRLRDPARFRSWLYGIVLNVCRGYLRERGAPALSLEALAGGLRFEAIPFVAGPDPQEVAEARDLQRRVLAAVAELPPRIRAATLLFYYEQRSVQEVAASLGVSVVAVKSRLHQARKRLRAELLPVYPELAGPSRHERRKPTMIPVTIVDVVARGTAPEKHYVVILWDAAGRRLLPIWIGPAEAVAIAMGLRGQPTERPLTYPFIASLLDAAGATLEAVEIATLQGDTFHAVVKLRRDGTTRAVDARPSDGLALAARTGSPISVAPAVLDHSGIAMPADFGPHLLGHGAAGIVRELEEQLQALQTARQHTPAEQTRSHEAFRAFLFAGDA